MRFFLRLRDIIHWHRAKNFLEKNDYVGFLGATEEVRLSAGLVPIVKLHRANCFYKLKDFDKAKSEYRSISDLEDYALVWKNKGNFGYLVEYSKLFLTIIETIEGRLPRSEVEQAYERLLAKDASIEMKENMFPPPNRSDISIWVENDDV